MCCWRTWSVESTLTRETSANCILKITQIRGDRFLNTIATSIQLHPFLFVICSLIALGIGPLAVNLSRGNRSFFSALEGFVLISVGGIVLFHVLPHSFKVSGAWAVGAMFMGLMMPMLMEKIQSISHDHVHAFVLVLVLIGFISHTAMDGVMMAKNVKHSPSQMAIVLGILVHRLPVGLVVWLFVRPIIGLFWSLLFLLVLGLSTIFGFWYFPNIRDHEIDHQTEGDGCNCNDCSKSDGDRTTMETTQDPKGCDISCRTCE